MRHAFLILAHKNYEQLVKFIDQLSFGEIFIHVDRKNEPLYERLKLLQKTRGGLHVLEKRERVNWSGLSIVKAELRLLQAANAYGDFDYFHMMSGQDLLLVNEDGFNKWFAKMPGAQYMDVKEAGSLAWRLQVYSFFRENPKNRTVPFRLADGLLRLVQVPFVRRKAFKGQLIWMGSTWFSITQDAVRWILKVTEEKQLERVYERTACPDEHYFQMILMNSPFQAALVHDTGRYIKWGSTASPKILTMTNYLDFMRSGCVIARKFDSTVDESVIEKVCEI